MILEIKVYTTETQGRMVSPGVAEEQAPPFNRLHSVCYLYL